MLSLRVSFEVQTNLMLLLHDGFYSG